MTFGAPEVGIRAAQWARSYFTVLCVVFYIVHSVRILQTQILQNAQKIILVPRRWVLALPTGRLPAERERVCHGLFKRVTTARNAVTEINQIKIAFFGVS